MLLLPSRLGPSVVVARRLVQSRHPLLSGRRQLFDERRRQVQKIRPPPQQPRVQPRVQQKKQIQQKWGDSVVDRGPIPQYFYIRHDSTILQPQFSGQTAWTGLLSIMGINFVVLTMWNSGNDSTQRKNHEEWMMQNFTTDITNTVQGRAWTLATASISHQDMLHFAGNMFAMWLFGFNTYRVIGTKAFYGLYLAGGLACSATHVLHNFATGKTDPPLSANERAELQEILQVTGGKLPPQAQERVATADQPALGASGSVMAISAVAATLFPLDNVRARGYYLPLPVAVGLFVLSDLSGLTVGGSPVDHAGHLGGMLMGIAYVTAAWYSKTGTFRILHSAGTAGQLPIVYRWRQRMNR